jgi:hypothetical protein
MADGSTMVFTATMLPFHSPLYTWRVGDKDTNGV